MLTFLKPTSKVEQEPDNTGSRSRAEIVLKHRNNDIILSLEIPHCRIYMIHVVTNIVLVFQLLYTGLFVVMLNTDQTVRYLEGLDI